MVVSILKAKSEACQPGTAASQQGPQTAGVPAAVLAKEAVYNAAGVGAYGLHDYIDFKQWFQSTLLQVCACTLPLSRPNIDMRDARLACPVRMKRVNLRKTCRQCIICACVSEEPAISQLAAELQHCVLTTPKCLNVKFFRMPFILTILRLAVRKLTQ